MKTKRGKLVNEQSVGNSIEATQFHRTFALECIHVKDFQELFYLEVEDDEGQ